jgi:uncharacterized membrane protein YedE/YeeE
MQNVLPDRLPWYIAGPALGLLVVALYAFGNKALGASGAYRAALGAVLRQPGAEIWRAWYFVGLFVGALAVAVLRGGPTVELGYATLGTVVPMLYLVPLLFTAGTLMGFGARWAGGCTSGHCLRGVSELSPASLGASATFFGVAVLLANALHVLTRGVL